MSMTKDEALKSLQNIVEYWTYKPTEVEAAKMAISALCGPTRKQVEKAWRGEWIGMPNMGVYDIACSKCGYATGIRFWSSDFCPNCGAPMTDKAVDMVMERLEALRDD